MPTKEKTIHKKLSEIQSKLKAPKGQYNKFGGFNYRNCEDILEALKPILNEYGCCVVLADDIKKIEDRYYVVSTAMIVDDNVCPLPCE